MSTSRGLGLGVTLTAGEHVSAAAPRPAGSHAADEKSRRLASSLWEPSGFFRPAAHCTPCNREMSRLQVNTLQHCFASARTQVPPTGPYSLCPVGFQTLRPTAA